MPNYVAGGELSQKLARLTAMTTPSNPKKRVLLNALWSLLVFGDDHHHVRGGPDYIQQLGLAAYGIFTLAMSVLELPVL